MDVSMAKGTPKSQPLNLFSNYLKHVLKKFKLQSKVASSQKHPKLSVATWL